MSPITSRCDENEKGGIRKEATFDVARYSDSGDRRECTLASSNAHIKVDIRKEIPVVLIKRERERTKKETNVAKDWSTRRSEELIIPRFEGLRE